MKITLKELRSIVKQVVNEARSEKEKAAAQLSTYSPYLTSREIPSVERPRITDTRIADAEQQLELRIAEQQNAFDWLLNLKDTQPERFIELLDELTPNLVDYGFTGSEASEKELRRFILTLQNQLKRIRKKIR